MNDIVPTNVLAKRGLFALGGIAGGILFLILRALHPAAGIILGAIVGIVGFSAFFSREPADKKAGLISAAAGVLSILSGLWKIFSGRGGPAGVLLIVGALGLLALGVWNAVQFFKGLKARS